MKLTMNRFIAIGAVSALMVVGTTFVVRAQTTDAIPACADLTDGSGTYTPPVKDTLGNTTSAGRLSWEMNLAAASCPDVQYSVAVYLADPANTGIPTLLGSATAAGDTVSNALRFVLEINTNSNGSICLVQSTFGAPESSTDSKNGAAFDADGAGSILLDRGPDGPAGGDVDPGGGLYCIPVNKNGSGGRTFG